MLHGTESKNTKQKQNPWQKDKRGRGDIHKMRSAEGAWGQAVAQTRALGEGVTQGK